MSSIDIWGVKKRGLNFGNLLLTKFDFKGYSESVK